MPKKNFSDDTDVFAALDAVEINSRKANRTVIVSDAECERMTFFLPKTLKRALKSRVFNSEDPSEKNMSAVVKIALEQYLNIKT